MDMLKKFFPLSFNNKDVVSLVIKCIILLVVGLLIGYAIKLVSLIPIVGILVGFVGGVVDLYILISIVLAILDYLKILK